MTIKAEIKKPKIKKKKSVLSDMQCVRTFRKKSQESCNTYYLLLH